MTYNRKTLIKIARENPDLIDVIEPMLKKGAQTDVTAEDLEFEVILLSDLVRAVKNAVANTHEDSRTIHWNLQPIFLGLQNLKKNCEHAIRELK